MYLRQYFGRCGGKGGANVAVGCLAIMIIYALSWLFTVGIIKAITICFGLSFSLLVATGIWLLIILLRSIFGGK